jgi:hypothetical protein
VVCYEVLFFYLFILFYLSYKAVIVGVFSHCTCNAVARNHIIVVTRSHIFLFPPSRTRRRRPAVVNYLHYVRRIIIIIIIMYIPLDRFREIVTPSNATSFFIFFFFYSRAVNRNESIAKNKKNSYNTVNLVHLMIIIPSLYYRHRY